jgi:catechol 2,3-dioxygenase-like lactoylglutathione lyase family enzyme
MVAIKAVAHFSIPVSDVARSTRFYTEVVGCRHLSTVPGGHMAFLDAAGTCLILVKRDAPINAVRDDHGGVHHAFAVAHDEYKAALDHLRARGVEIQPRGGPSYGHRVAMGAALPGIFHASRQPHAPPSRRTGRAACSTARALISTIPMARCWSSSI